MTGSGMGCPDWPKCFGQVVPPTDISPLPTDYKTRVAVQGKEIADFDPYKTWIEYVNRLVGMLIGVFAFATVVFAIPLRKMSPPAFWWSIVGLFFVVLAGGLGAMVVKTDLQPGLITLHMVIAFLALASFLMATFAVANKDQIGAVTIPKNIKALSVLLLAFTLVQIIMGTQVREQVDEIAIRLGEANRASWVGELIGVYSLHKLFHYGLFLVLIGLSVQLKPFRRYLGPVRKLLIISFGLLVTEALVGISMHNFDIPAFLQPIHLLLAAFLFASEIGILGWLLIADRQAKPLPANNE